MACDHFLFFFGCIMSPAQWRTEREISLQSFPNGYSCVSRHSLWLGTVESQGQLSPGKKMHFTKFRKPATSTERARSDSVVLFGAWSLLACWLIFPFAFVGFCMSNVPWLMLLLVKSVQAAHNPSTSSEIVRMETKRHQIREEIGKWIFS